MTSQLLVGYKGTTSEREDTDNKLQNLHMKDGNLDQYVAEFNRLSHLAD